MKERQRNEGKGATLQSERELLQKLETFGRPFIYNLHGTQLFRTHEARRNSHQPIIENCSRTSAVQMDLGAGT